MIIAFTIYMIVYALLSFIFLIIIGIVAIGIFIFDTICEIIENIGNGIRKFIHKFKNKIKKGK